MKMSPRSKSAQFQLAAESRGTLRFQEVDSRGFLMTHHNPGTVLGTVYFRRPVWGVNHTPPRKLRITVEEVE